MKDADKQLISLRVQLRMAGATGLLTQKSITPRATDLRKTRGSQPSLGGHQPRLVSSQPSLVGRHRVEKTNVWIDFGVLRPAPGQVIPIPQ